jgi:hypothetical protein
LIQIVEPDSVSIEDVRFTFLFPLEGDPREVQRRYAEGLSGELLPEAKPGDAALLLDGRSDRIGANFQVEFGVVSSGEIPSRLTGGAGRLGPNQTSVEPDVASAPDCAFFLDWNWTFQKGQGEGDLAEVVGYWEGLSEESLLLSTRIVETHTARNRAQGKEPA